MSVPEIQLVDLTAPTLLGVAILLLLTGRLVPRVFVKDKEEECLHWREAYEAEREARLTSDGQTIELLELAKTTNALMTALFQVTEAEQIAAWRASQEQP